MHGKSKPHCSAVISGLLQALSACLAFSLVGCNSTSSSSPATVAANDELSPLQAVAAVHENPYGVKNTFRMTIRGAGRGNGRLYLNSRADYHDPHCLTLALTNSVDRDLREQLHGDPVKALIGKDVIVSGTAERVTIWAYDENGVKSDVFYYQTQIPVFDMAQIKLVSP